MKLTSLHKFILLSFQMTTTCAIFVAATIVMWLIELDACSTSKFIKALHFGVCICQFLSCLCSTVLIWFSADFKNWVNQLLDFISCEFSNNFKKTRFHIKNQASVCFCRYQWLPGFKYKSEPGMDFSYRPISYIFLLTLSWNFHLSSPQRNVYKIFLGNFIFRACWRFLDLRDILRILWKCYDFNGH